MLEIITGMGVNFGHPKDLLRYMQEEKIEKVNMKIRYCCVDVAATEMRLQEVKRWANSYLSVACLTGTLGDAVKIIKAGMVEQEGKDRWVE